MTAVWPLVRPPLCSRSSGCCGFLLTGLICNSLSLLYLLEISDSRDADSISLDSTDEDGARRSLQGAVTSMDEALMKVTGAAEHAQEDFLTQNFGTLNHSCSAGRRKQTSTSRGYLGILGQRGSEKPFIDLKVTDSRFSI